MRLHRLSSLIVFLLVGTLAGVMPCVAHAVTPTPATLSKAAHAYFHDQQTHNYTAACHMLAPYSLTTWGDGSIAACVKMFKAQGFHAKTMQIDSLDANDTRGIVDTHLDGKKSHQWQMVFVFQNSTWLIAETTP